MLDLAVTIYSCFFYSLYILFFNPGGYLEIEVIRIFTISLTMVLCLRIILALINDTRLNRRFNRCSETDFPDLYSIYKMAADKLQMKKLPPLYIFADFKPLVFTAGILRCSVYIAPDLIKRLGRNELEAIFLHELTHVKRKDNLRTLLNETFIIGIFSIVFQLAALSHIGYVEDALISILFVLVCIFSFKCLLWKKYLFMRELSCDDMCIRVMNDPLDFAGVLLKVYNAGLTLPEYFPRFSFARSRFLMFSFNFEHRVKRLIDYKEKSQNKVAFNGIRLLLFCLLMIFSVAAFRFHEHVKNIHWDSHGHKYSEYPHMCNNNCLIRSIYLNDSLVE